MKNVIQIFLITSIIIISGCSQGTQEVEDPQLSEFAKCIKESGMKMYGSMTCSVCKRQRELFGSSFKHVGEIECHPRGENPQTELCLQKDIEKTPTWILEKNGEDLKKLEGYQTLETLAEISGCKLGV
jgi:hypothetical protein